MVSLINVMKLPSIIARGSSYLRDSYAIDYRSLAVFRIAVGLVALYELLARFQLRHAFYTDAGVLPRRDAVQTVTSAQWSLLMINGTSAFVTLFFLVAIVAAVLFTIGWKTRIASVVLWVAVLSIQFRNPYLNNGGDVLLRASLFWAMFLPLSSVWSLDEFKGRDRDDRSNPTSTLSVVASIAGLALIAQQFVVYFCTALLKTDDQWKSDGSALYYALGLRDYTNGFGDWLFHNASGELLRILTFSALMLEYVAPLLLILPFSHGPFRTLGVFLIVGLHLGIMSTMTVGLFPFISIASAMGILPTWFWQKFLSRVTSLSRRFIFLRIPSMDFEIGGYSGRPKVLSPHTDGVTASASHFINSLPRIRISKDFAANVIVSVALVSMLLSNLSFVSAYELPDSAWNVTHATGLRQRWNMFAPKPVIGTRWYVVEGELSSGKKIDLLVALDQSDMSLQEPVSWDQSGEVQVKSKIWRKYFASLRGKDVRIQSFARYTCRTWNAQNSGDNSLVNIRITSAISKTLPNSQRDEPAYSQWISWNCG